MCPLLPGYGKSSNNNESNTYVKSLKMYTIAISSLICQSNGGGEGSDGRCSMGKQAENRENPSLSFLRGTV